MPTLSCGKEAQPLESVPVGGRSKEGRSGCRDSADRKEYSAEQCRQGALVVLAQFICLVF